MQLIYESVALSNFASIRELEFVFDRHVGAYLVLGRNEVEPELETNGAGKSSIFDAACWAQYGKTVDGRRSPDIVPWHGGQPSVALRLTTDGVQHEIVRTHAPNSLQLDGRDTSQEEIEQKLGGLSYETAINTLFLGQGRPLFFDLPPAKKLQLFSDVLHLDRWEKRAAKASGNASGLSITVGSEEARTETLLQQYLEVRNLHIEARNRCEEWDRNHLDRVREAEQELEQLTVRQEALKQHHDDADLVFDGAEAELRALAPEIAQLEEYLTHLRSERAEAAAKVESARSEVARLRSDFNKLMHKKVCPTCGQKIGKDANMQTHLQTTKERFADLDEVVANGVPSALDASVADVEQQLVILRETRERFTAQRDEAMDTLHRDVHELADMTSRLSRCREALDENRVVDNPLRQPEADLRERRETLWREYNQCLKLLKRAQGQLAATEFWIRGFRDIRLQIVDEVLQELTLASNAALERLGLIGWQISYDIERETKSGTVERGLYVSILSPHNGAPVRWECWSGGEGQRLKILGALALSETLLNRAGIQPNLTLLDEPTTFLSPRGVQDVTEFLHDWAIQLERRIYLVDQTVTPSDRFASVLTVVRRGDGTEVLG